METDAIRLVFGEHTDNIHVSSRSRCTATRSGPPVRLKQPRPSSAFIMAASADGEFQRARPGLRSEYHQERSGRSPPVSCFFQFLRLRRPQRRARLPALGGVSIGSKKQIYYLARIRSRQKYSRCFWNFAGTRQRSGQAKQRGRLGFRSLKSLRRVAGRNLEIAMPETSATERFGIIKGAFESLGRVLGEMSQFPRATRESLEKLIEFRFDPALLAKHESLRAEGRGTIIVSPHLGNWELLVFAYSALREPISYLARPLDNPLIEDLTVKLRTRFGNRPMNKTNSVPAAIKVLREGGILGILADVNAHPKEGVFVPFFDFPACTSAGVCDAGDPYEFRDRSPCRCLG